MSETKIISKINEIGDKVSPSDLAFSQSLSVNIESAIRAYVSKVGEDRVSDLYNLVIQEVERPFLKLMMALYRNNQSRTARHLAISRGTLRKKLKLYNLISDGSSS